MLIVGLALMAACGQDGAPVVEPAADVHVSIGRLDQDLFHASADGMSAASLAAYARYGEFYRIYIEDILQGAPVNDPRLAMVLNSFVRDPDWSAAQQGVDSVLGDMERQRVLFESAFARLHALFPDSVIPRIVSFNSGYNFGIFPTDSVLGFGAEWFIGPDHPVIGYLAPEAFPNYVKARMRPEMLVPSAVKGWLLVHYTRDVQGEDLLSNLVETGKVMALLDALLPEVDPSLKLAFSPEQLAWCEANEYLIWKELAGKDQIYSKKEEDIGRWMSDGPFTSGLPRESPGHLGEWVGLRMVRSCMKDDPKLTFAQLFAMNDPREILKHYKPR